MASVPHSFKICSEKKSLFVFADTEEDRIAWRRKIREAVRALHPTTRRGQSMGPEGSDGVAVYGFSGLYHHRAFMLFDP
jgi:hypothetical protein